MTAAGLPITVSENVMSIIWSKFVHNCAINAVSAITGLRPGEIARNPSAAWIMEALLDEILAVVDRAGIDLPENDPRAEIYDNAWERYNKPSMLQHLEAGRATEIDALNGALVKKANSLGIAAPVNATIAATVWGIEAQRQMRSNNAIIDEATMEALARSNPAPVGGTQTPDLFAARSSLVASQIWVRCAWLISSGAPAPPILVGRSPGRRSCQSRRRR
jgi:2-dehydropantoate 2-reductase